MLSVENVSKAFDGVLEEFCDLGRTGVVVREDRGSFLIFADFEHLSSSAADASGLFRVRCGEAYPPK